MKRIALTLAAFGVLGVAANQALAEGAISYPMAAHVAAKYGIHHPGLNQAVRYQEAARYRQGYRHQGYGHQSYRHQIYGHHGYGGPAAVVIHPRGYGGGVAVVPYATPYYPRSYYYGPSRGFSYSGRGFSFGFGF